MRSGIMVVIIAAGVGGLASSAYAQEAKKLEHHPEAAADSALQQGRVELPSPMGRHAGGAGASAAKPETGPSVKQGGSSTAEAKHGN